MHTLGIDAFSSRAEKSGVEWYTHHLLRAMQPLTPPEWRVFLYSPDTPALRSRKARESDMFHSREHEAVGGGWQQTQLHWPPRRAWGQVRLSWEMLRRPPNVLFVPASMIPLVHPHRANEKQWTVTTIHDVGFFEFPDRYAPADRRRQEIALQFALRHATIIFVPSAATKNALEKHASPNTLMVTPLGVDHTHYRPRDAAEVPPVLQKYKITAPYVLFVGRIDAKKNLDSIVRAYAADRDRIIPRLVLAGTLGFKAAELQALIGERNLTDRVQFLGYVPEDDLPALYAGARAFVFPSAVEGFGLPVLQALAVGTPTIAADIPALREVAGDTAVFVPPFDTAAWQRELARAATESPSQDRRTRGMERARDFSWERCAALTWQAIQDLIQ